jgi:hypothetical protein
MLKSTFLLSAAGAVVLALASERAVTRTFDSRPTQSRHLAVWAYRPQDPAQMARDVDAVVVATLADVRPGRVVYASSELGNLSFELHEFVVEQAIKGPGAGEILTVERAAGGPPEALIPDDDGGAYVKGRRYLLFLRRQSTTPLFYLVHPEGRYAVADDGVLTAATEGPVAALLSKQPLKEVLALLQPAVGER